LTGTTDGVLFDQALAKVKRQVRQYDGDFNLIVPLAELRDLRRTIVGSAALSQKLMWDLINIRATKGKSAAKWASQAWLNYGFGVKPLINDAKDIANSIAAYLSKKQGVRNLSGSASKDWVKSGKADGFTGTYHARMKTNFHQICHLSYRFTGAYDVAISAANDYAAADHFHLDTGLLPAAWELIPYSWVVDYFTTMGAFLDDAFTTPGGTTKYLTCSRRFTCDYTEDISHYIDPLSFPNERYKAFLENTNGVGFVSLYEFERTSYTSIPSRSLRLKTVDEVGQHAVNKLLNLSSIFIGSRFKTTK
jgi:hypothetical protein